MIKQRVSELITIEDIKTWKANDIITISAGTGSGKSYFIKNILYAFAKKENKKILMLIHRTNCTNQFYEEIKRDNKLDIIHIKTYQSIETKILNKKEVNLSEYKYIVSDEFHYFISDASFNITTDISLNKILNQSNATKIFMSATGNHVRNYINNIKKLETIDYKMQFNYDFIKELTFYKLDSTLDMFVKECLNNNQKAIFFIQSAEKAYNLYSKYKDNCLFNCSKSNDKYYKYVDCDKINDMLNNEKFEENILITTTCMDAGVNIIDTNLKHIICDIKDIGTLIQCIGRKRIQNKNDGIYLYIKTINNKQLGGMKTQVNKRIKKADFLREHTVREYIEEFPRSYDYNNIVYDGIIEDKNNCTKKINELMYFKCLCDMCDIDIIGTYGKYAYNKYLAYKFNIERYRLIEEDNNMTQLELYLESIIDKRLYKEEQKELINKINVRVDGKIQKSYSKLNQGLQMLELPYIIISKRIKENNKLRTIWIINKL
ncbi:UNVERIFIED_ORG: DNA helicase [Clostridium botulinum]